MIVVRIFAALACIGFIGGCASSGVPENPSPAAELSNKPDSAANMVPAGFGSLRQDEIAIRLDAPGLVLRAVPLDEGIIRLLTPDSYRVLRELQESNRPRIADILRRNGGRPPALWYVSFYGIDPDTRYSPLDLVITSGGRDFRAIDIIPLSAGWGEQRLRQRETQSAIYIFDGEIDTDHPLSVRFLSERDESWEQTLQRIERERALVRARAGRAEK
jgi:hypothetical protein